MVRLLVGGGLAVAMVMVGINWGYQKWHIHQYCQMKSDQLVCIRIVDAGLSTPWCEGDYEQAMRTRAENLRLGAQFFSEAFLAKQEALFRDALPKERELNYRECTVRALK